MALPSAIVSTGIQLGRSMDERAKIYPSLGNDSEDCIIIGAIVWLESMFGPIEPLSGHRTPSWPLGGYFRLYGYGVLGLQRPRHRVTVDRVTQPVTLPPNAEVNHHRKYRIVSIRHQSRPSLPFRYSNHSIFCLVLYYDCGSTDNGTRTPPHATRS